LKQKYRLEFIVASHDPARWNFSENTNLSEVLLVAVKETGRASSNDKPVISLNLWRNPTTTFEALAIHNAIPSGIPNLAEGQGSAQLSVGQTKAGEAISVRWGDLKKDPLWILPAAFAQTDLTRAAYHLMRGKLWLPGKRGVHRLPLCPLSSLGALGPDRRDIHDGFGLSQEPTAYPSFWGHDASAVFTLEQKPNKFLIPLVEAKPGRGLRKLEHLWPLAGKLLLAERLWLKTQRLVALHLTEPVLSNMWWTFAFKKLKKTEQLEKSLALWLNSTIALLILLASREETRGAWVDFKKPVLASLPVVNLADLSTHQLRILTACYDQIAGKALQPLPEMASDQLRATVDAAVAKALRLPDFSILRTLLAREPVVSLNRL
jgi:hypothetical protein